MANSATIQKEWLLVDAENQPVGRLASVVAMLVPDKLCGWNACCRNARCAPGSTALVL